MDFNTTLYQILTEKFDITLDYATQCLTAVLSGEKETRMFGLSQPCPCMKMETVLYGPGNSPVEALFACYRGISTNSDSRRVTISATRPCSPSSLAFMQW